MRLFAISDLHVDYRQNLDWVRGLSRSDYVEDALVVAGDISHRAALVAEVFGALRRRFAVVFFVPGNHDLWVRDGAHPDSLTKFHALRALCDEHEIEMEPRRLGGVDPGAFWVVPLLSWYSRPEEDESSLFVEKRGEDPSLSMWVDNWAVVWPDFGGGIDAAGYFIGRNESAVSARYDAPVLSFSHFLPRRELMFLTERERATWTGPLVDPVPSFNFSRVAGTSRLDDQIRRLGAELHVYGHQHRNRALTIDGVRYLSHCLGYPRERAFGRTRGLTDGPLLLRSSEVSAVV